MATETNRVIEIATPLEKDALLFYRMRGREELSRLFEYDVQLLSSDPAIDLDAVLGQPVTIALRRQDDGARYFNAYVTRIAEMGVHGRHSRYAATVRPWLWFLTRRRNCRNFQMKTVPEMVKEVFDDHAGIADVQWELTEAYTPWEYCTQYRESDFDFVSRLLEHEGIYYFFKHIDGRHTLVLVDSYSAHAYASDQHHEIPFIAEGQAAAPELEHVSDWAVTREVQPGKYALKDFDFERPSVDLQVKSMIKREHALAEYEFFDYPGDYIQRTDGEQYVRLRHQEVQATFERTQGRTNWRDAAVGFLFKLTSHPREDQNAEYLIVSTDIELQSSEYEAMGDPGVPGPSCSCGFTALNSQYPFRAERITPKPMVRGPQTAIVVGPGGETIHTDKYGRVKVQFHWDRYAKGDDTASCWIRVSQNWGGKGWGGMFIPHVGQEVIVMFEEGDPDRPLVMGRVYNAEQMPPNALPASKTQSIIRDHGSNVIVMEGVGGKEQITLLSPHSSTWVTMGAP